MTEEETRQVWQEARTFEDLCSVTAEFIQGKIPCSPTHLTEPNDETDRIQGSLVRLNAMGFLTTSSQPAMALVNGCAQRAFIKGFAQERLARQLAEKTFWSDLCIIQGSPSGGEKIPHDVLLDRMAGRVPVTVQDGKPCTWVGFIDPMLDVDQFKRLCSPSAIAELESAWYVVAIDLAWGREDHLWDVLLASSKPGHSVQNRS